MKNREIKFRVFIDGEMIDADALAFEQYLPVSQLLSNCDNIMQFTGLHDKNGKEIYEGDIVSLAGFSVDSKYMDLLSGYVLFFNGGFSVKENDNGYYLSTVHETCTVIGNLHQHPELLK